MAEMVDNILVISLNEHSMEALQQIAECRKLLGDHFSFQKIIPMPGVLEGTVSGADSTPNNPLYHNEGEEPGYRPATREEKQEMEKIGYHDWAGWRYDNWGVKWDVKTESAGNVRSDGASLYVSFATPYDPPVPVYQELANRFPRLKIAAAATNDPEEDCDPELRVYRPLSPDQYSFRDLEFGIADGLKPALMARTREMKGAGPNHWVKCCDLNQERFSNLLEYHGNNLVAVREMARDWMGRACYVEGAPPYLTIRKWGTEYRLVDESSDSADNSPYPQRRVDALADRLFTAGLKNNVWEGKDLVRIYLDLPKDWNLLPGTIAFVEYSPFFHKKPLDPVLEPERCLDGEIHLNVHSRDSGEAIRTLILDYGVDELVQVDKQAEPDKKQRETSVTVASSKTPKEGIKP